MSTDSTISQWGPHFGYVDQITGASTVTTPELADVDLRISEAVRDRTIMLVTGKAGSGKSFASARAIEHATTRYPDVQPVWLEIAETIQGRALAIDLFPQVTGAPAPPRAPLSSLRATMLDYLTAAPRVIVLDEAQQVTGHAMELLRWFHSRSQQGFALVIVATPEIEQKLPAMLSSRIMSHVEVRRITNADAPTVLVGYHPLYRTLPAERISELNRVNAGGEFRWWAKFTLRAHRYMQALDTDIVTDDVIDSALQDLRNGTR